MKTPKFIILASVLLGVVLVGTFVFKNARIDEFCNRGGPLMFGIRPEFLSMLCLDKGIEGNTELKVTLFMDNNIKNPLPNIEVDVAKKPGQPPKGGVAITNDQGIATFNIKPGSYFIYFNNLTFPKNLSTPEPQSITVVEGAANEKTLLITTQNNN